MGAEVMNYDDAIERIKWKSQDSFELDGVRFRLVLSDFDKHTSANNDFVLLKNKELIEAYRRIFKNFKPNSIVEFGGYDGGSTVFLHRAFQPKKIITIDLRRDAPFLRQYISDHSLSNNIYPNFSINQADETSVKKILNEHFRTGSIDLIIDDASHQFEYTRSAFNASFPFLKQGGMYVIEDWGWAHWPGIWQESQWVDEPAMTNFIFEIVMAAATSPDIIEEIIINCFYAAIRKGTREIKVDQGFRIQDVYLNRGRKIDIFGVCEKDENIRNIESLLKEKEIALNRIYRSRGWKALSIIYRLIEKIFPINSKRRLIAKVIFKAITEPETVVKAANIANLKKFPYRLGSVELPFLEKDREKKASELRKVDEVGQGVLESNKPHPMFGKTGYPNLLQALSHVIDQKWLDVLIQSIQQPVIEGVELPGFPPDEFQRHSVGSSGETALREIFPFYCEIKRYTNELGLKLTQESHILDFGCGWGRIIRFFLKDVMADNLYGIDVDPEMVELCQKLVRYGNYSLCNPVPPTEFSNESMDIVYAYSVFSHLAEPVHIKWIGEFSRILKPGGLLVVTTRPRYFVEFCRSLRGKKHDFECLNVAANSFLDTEAVLADYDSGKFVFSPIGKGPAAFFGEALIPRAYIEREWTKYLEFRNFVDDQTLLPQAMVIMQKPFNSC
jgi:SAM-dependent methyltransferase